MNKHRHHVWSGVEFPQVVVRKTENHGFSVAHTGQTLAQRVPGLDKSDPHSFLTGHWTNRIKLLVSATELALAQLCSQEEVLEKIINSGHQRDRL
jgi:hypothetical protein